MSKNELLANIKIIQTNTLLGDEQALRALIVVGAASLVGIEPEKVMDAIKEKYPHHAMQIDKDISMLLSLIAQVNP